MSCHRIVKVYFLFYLILHRRQTAVFHVDINITLKLVAITTAGANNAVVFGSLVSSILSSGDKLECVVLFNVIHTVSLDADTFVVCKRNLEGK